MTRWIPQNDPSAIYQWKPSPVVKIIWQFKPATYCITKFPDYLKPGRAMQIKWLKSYVNGGPHTIILTSISPDAISYWESNGNAGKFTVGHHTESIKDWGRHAEAWTVYQVI